MVRNSIEQPASSILSHQVQWQHPMVVRGGVDQTRLAIADETVSARSSFSFTVIGDTDAGNADVDRADNFSAAFAEQLMQQLGESQFLLHTGDVTYPLGTYQNYLSGFLQPYRDLLSVVPERADYGCNRLRERLSDSSPSTQSAVSKRPVFERPVLPVLGNHDCAQLPFWANCRQQALRFLCDRLRQLTGLDLGQYGGQGGEAFGQTFLDDLSKLSSTQLKHYLLEHYNVPIETLRSSAEPAYCLNYVPGQFTRLPNRYYTFHYGGIDFFALDSNTWNTAPQAPGFDREQLDWLTQGLIDSWRSPHSVGRILYLHHSPYTTEESRWQQPETLWVRRHLRQVLNQVKTALSSKLSDRILETSPLVDLVISGHAHCLEHLKTTQTGHADADLDWLVCGGSGASIRRQRQAGADLLETLSAKGRSTTEMVARSQLYAGVHGQKEKKQRFHSFVQIDVQPNSTSLLTVRPFIVVKGHHGWTTRALTKISLKKRSPCIANVSEGN